MCQLSPSDAGTVHAIYTDIKDYTNTGHGEVNFYPNNGQNQPLCTNQSNHCNHIMALKYFEASIRNPTCFPATPCSSWDEFISGSCDKNNKQYMGFNANKVQSLPGNFYIIPSKFQVCCKETHSCDDNALNKADPYPKGITKENRGNSFRGYNCRDNGGCMNYPNRLAKDYIPWWGIMLIVISCLALLGVIIFRVYKRVIHRHYEEIN